MSVNKMPEIWFPKLGIQIDHLSKIAFNIFGMEVYWYGIFIVIGVAVGLHIANKQADKYGLGSDISMDFIFYALIFSMIGARLYYIIFSWDYYKNDLSKIFAFRQGGLAIYGAIIAASITAVVFAKVKKTDLRLLVDCFAPGLAAGQAIGRWGNFINREAFGGYTDSLFALRYATAQVEYISPDVLKKVLVISGVEYIQVHPAFLYESIWNLCLCILLVRYASKKKFKGEIFMLYLLGYGLGRLWIEGLRTDQLMLFGTGVPVSQLLSFILVITSICIILFARRKISLVTEAGETAAVSLFGESNENAVAETGEATIAEEPITDEKPIITEEPTIIEAAETDTQTESDNSNA